MSTAPHKQLRYKLNQLRQAVEKKQQDRRQQRLDDLKKNKAPNTPQPLPKSTGSEAMAFFGFVRERILNDQKRLVIIQPAPPPAPQPEGEAAAPEAPQVSTPAPAPVPTPVPVLTPTYTMPNTPVFAPLVEKYMATEPLLPLPPEPHTGPANPHVLALLRHELELLIETNTQLGNIPGPLLAKLKQAVQAYGEGRTTDSVTVLKNALTGDPHNQTLLMCLSQVLYALAANGIATALPEARDYAQRSIIANQKYRPTRLSFYQYLAVVTERAFSEERTMEWLRDTGLLDASLLQSPEGLLAQHGIPLRAWGLLSTISPNLWGETEFKALRLVVTNAIGGGALYMCWLRDSLLQASAVSKVPLPEVESIEKILHTAATEHATLTQSLAQVVAAGANHTPWLLRWRWLRTFGQVGGIPALETVLLHVALDGQNWRENTYPDSELQALLDDPSLYTWRIWAQTITPFKDVRKPFLIPAEETLSETEFLKEAEVLLALLKAAEVERIKANIWADIKPWLVRWQLDHFLAAATGSNQPRSRFAPTLFPFNHFYRRWQEPFISSILASEVLAEVARRGGFANWFEVIAAFDGALRLMDDPVHGMQSTQKRAYIAAQKAAPGKFTGKAVDFGLSKGSGIGMVLAPFGFMGALLGIFSLSANTSQAIGLSLALFGLAGVVMLNLGKK